MLGSVQRLYIKATTARLKGLYILEDAIVE